MMSKAIMTKTIARDILPTGWTVHPDHDRGIPAIFSELQPYVVASRMHEPTGAVLSIWRGGTNFALVWRPDTTGLNAERDGEFFGRILKEFCAGSFADFECEDSLTTVFVEAEAVFHSGPPNEIAAVQKEIAARVASFKAKDDAIKREECERIAREHRRDVHIITDGQEWKALDPAKAKLLAWCNQSNAYTDPSCGLPGQWVAVRDIKDQKAFETVVVNAKGAILKRYPNSYSTIEQASYAAVGIAANLRSQIENWLPDKHARELSPGVRQSRWAHAVWERKHPKGPVLVIWKIEPLPLYVGGWISWGGSSCIPTPAGYVIETDPTLIDWSVDRLGTTLFEEGPGEKMIERSRDIAAKYAASGRKGGQASKGAKPKAPK